MQDDATTRYCSRCQNDLPLADFGSHNYCRRCYSDYQKQYKQAHKKPAKPKTPKVSKPIRKPKPKPAPRDLTPEERRVRSDKSYRHHWGIGIDELERLSAAQGNVCSSCGEPQTPHRPILAPFGNKATKALYGFLCTHCNTLRYAVPALDERPDKLDLVRAFLSLDHTPLETSYSAPRQEE